MGASQGIASTTSLSPTPLLALPAHPNWSAMALACQRGDFRTWGRIRNEKIAWTSWAVHSGVGPWSSETNMNPPPIGLDAVSGLKKENSQYHVGAD